MDRMASALRWLGGEFTSAASDVARGKAVRAGIVVTVSLAVGFGQMAVYGGTGPEALMVTAATAILLVLLLVALANL